MKTKACLLVVVALLAWGLKRHYADARADELWWILSPTARLSGAATGVTFIATPGEGYISRERLFVIETSCAGVTFRIAAFVLVSVALLHRVRARGSAAAVIAASLATSYVAAVLVNTVRIVIAMWLAAHPLSAPFDAAEVHRVEGIVVYFLALVLLHEMARHAGREPRERRSS